MLQKQSLFAEKCLREASDEPDMMDKCADKRYGVEGPNSDLILLTSFFRLPCLQTAEIQHGSHLMAEIVKNSLMGTGEFACIYYTTFRGRFCPRSRKSMLPLWIAITSYGAASSKAKHGLIAKFGRITNVFFFQPIGDHFDLPSAFHMLPRPDLWLVCFPCRMPPLERP